MHGDCAGRQLAVILFTIDLIIVLQDVCSSVFTLNVLDCGVRACTFVCVAVYNKPTRIVHIMGRRKALKA